MINLDQVRTLEWKVKQAVQLIVHLRRENDTLRGRLSDTEVRLQELETLLESFKATQNEMESGIRSALEELDNLESDESPAQVTQVDPLSYPPQPPEAAAAPETLPDPGPQAEPVSEPAASVSDDPSFDEEYAALAAAEAEALEAMASEEPEGVAEPVPSSVELIEESVSFESEAEEEIEVDLAPEEPVVEEKRPEQPGLGIF